MDHLPQFFAQGSFFWLALCGAAFFAILKVRRSLEREIRGGSPEPRPADAL